MNWSSFASVFLSHNVPVLPFVQIMEDARGREGGRGAREVTKVNCAARGKCPKTDFVPKKSQVGRIDSKSTLRERIRPPLAL